MSEDDLLEDEEGYLLPDTQFARAYIAAERRRDEEEALRLEMAAILEAGIADERVYYAFPYFYEQYAVYQPQLGDMVPYNPRLYEGTGIGALYGLRGCAAPELGGWQPKGRT